jgi:hypothetical protein
MLYLHIKISDMKAELTEQERRTLRIKNRCNKSKHTPSTNPFGVTWCKDCGNLMKG